MSGGGVSWSLWPRRIFPFGYPWARHQVDRDPTRPRRRSTPCRRSVESDREVLFIGGQEIPPSPASARNWRSSYRSQPEPLAREPRWLLFRSVLSRSSAGARCRMACWCVRLSSCWSSLLASSRRTRRIFAPWLAGLALDVFTAMFWAERAGHVIGGLLTMTLHRACVTDAVQHRVVSRCSTLMKPWSEPRRFQLPVRDQAAWISPDRRMLCR